MHRDWRGAPTAAYAIRTADALGLESQGVLHIVAWRLEEDDMRRALQVRASASVLAWQQQHATRPASASAAAAAGCVVALRLIVVRGSSIELANGVGRS